LAEPDSEIVNILLLHQDESLFARINVVTGNDASTGGLDVFDHVLDVRVVALVSVFHGIPDRRFIIIFKSESSFFAHISTSD